MSVKRRDHKNRILRSGESQRKDGRYAYKYVDAAGQPQFVYSWKLEKTDPLPAGKRDCEALREKEKVIQKDLEDGIDTKLGEMTVSQLTERYLQQKEGLARKTLESYNTVLNNLKKDKFGSKKINTVKSSDVQRWFVQLKKEGYAYSSIHTIRAVLKPAFRNAVEDDVIRKNPFDFVLSRTIRNDGVKKEALTEEEESRFLDFIKNDKLFSKHYCGIFILFKTGMRISEFAGLTIHDLDFKNGNIYINNQLQRMENGEYVVDKTKTNAGKRVLPMNSEVCMCFKQILNNRKTPQVEPLIGGKSGFLYLDRNGMPMISRHWQGYLDRICAKYNATHAVQMPQVTPHVCRHTYCTNMVKKGMPLKVLQYLMGHSSIDITMDIYTHYSTEDIRSAWDEVK